MAITTQNTRITRMHELLSPATVRSRHPVSDLAAQTVQDGREAIRAILDHRDDRIIAVVGPCSIHDPVAAVEYAGRLRSLRDELSGDRRVLILPFLLFLLFQSARMKELVLEDPLEGVDPL